MTRARSAGVLAALIGGIACGGAQTTASRPTGDTRRGIEAASLPYQIVRVTGGRNLTMAEFLADAADEQVVCIGETHNSPHDHWAQLELFDRLSAQNSAAGVSTALGMEMFQQPFQGVLDDYAAGKIDDAALLSRSGWQQRWGHDWELYGPIVRLARDRKGAILALNASSELKKQIRDKGIDGLDEQTRKQVPELVLDDKDHRAWWDTKMAEMGGVDAHSKEAESPAPDATDDKLPDAAPEGEPVVPPTPEEQAKVDNKKAADQMYMIQVLWDESMADAAARWVRAGLKRQVVILAGNGHCHTSAIVKRVRRRGVQRAISVHPLIDKGDGEVATLLATPENEFLFVMTMPAGKSGH